jgi:hypothetical protein
LRYRPGTGIGLDEPGRFKAALANRLQLAASELDGDWVRCDKVECKFQPGFSYMLRSIVRYPETEMIQAAS